MRSLLLAPLAVFTSLVVFLSSPTVANATILDVESRGFYLEDGFHTTDFDGYLTGFQGVEFRSFFVFRIPLLSEPAMSASLRLWMPPGSFASNKPSEPLTVWSVETAIDILVEPHDPGETGEEIFADLGEGTAYGTSIVTSPGENGNYLYITLNEDALAMINAAQENQLIAFGISLPEVNKEGESIAFQNTATGDGVGAWGAQLVIPEPTVLLLFGASVFGLLLLRRRRDHTLQWMPLAEPRQRK